jgi:hypothetical protein
VNAQISQSVSTGLVLLGELFCPSGPTCSGPVTQNFNTRTQAAGIFQQPKTDCLANTLPYDPATCMSAGIVTRGIVTDAGGNFIYSGNPAHSGQALIMWLTGLGAAAKNVATGYTESILRPEIWLLNMPIRSGSTVIANLLASQKATTLFAGPTADAGLDQINFTFDLSALRQGSLCGKDIADDLGLAVRLATAAPGTGYSNIVRLPIVVDANEFPCS